jgi:hypothetical protein
VIGPGRTDVALGLQNNSVQESDVLRRRIDEVRANMARYVEGIKQFAERHREPSGCPYVRR